MPTKTITPHTTDPILKTQRARADLALSDAQGRVEQMNRLLSDATAGGDGLDVVTRLEEQLRVATEAEQRQDAELRRIDDLLADEDRVAVEHDRLAHLRSHDVRAALRDLARGTGHEVYRRSRRRGRGCPRRLTPHDGCRVADHLMAVKPPVGPRRNKELSLSVQGTGEQMPSSV